MKAFEAHRPAWRIWISDAPWLASRDAPPMRKLCEVYLRSWIPALRKASFKSLTKAFLNTAVPVLDMNKGPDLEPLSFKYSDIAFTGQCTLPGYALILWVDTDPALCLYFKNWTVKNPVSKLMQSTVRLLCDDVISPILNKAWKAKEHIALNLDWEKESTNIPLVALIIKLRMFKVIGSRESVLTRNFLHPSIIFFTRKESVGSVIPRSLCTKLKADMMDKIVPGAYSWSKRKATKSAKTEIGIGKTKLIPLVCKYSQKCLQALL